MSLTELERHDITERRLAAVYKQGEVAEAAGEIDAAIGHYLRLAEVSPGSEMAAQGHFDGRRHPRRCG